MVVAETLKNIEFLEKKVKVGSNWKECYWNWTVKSGWGSDYTFILTVMLVLDLGSDLLRGIPDYFSSRTGFILL